ncbi:MAG TPA: TonB C-terminal domain-containing protein [Thermomicrobiales bacterium]|nr:TonB C-terminal domain-containing protein [Thermomicrobiales bacterium]
MIFGSPGATGQAANASEGDLPAVGPKNDQAQALLSRDSIAGRIGDDSVMSVLPRASREAANVASSAAASAASAVAFGPPQADDASASPRPTHQPPVRASMASSDHPGADSAPMSDSESDLFTPNTQIDFRTGRVDARLGRKVTTVRPQLSLADQYDLMTMLSPHIQVRLHINRDGSIRKVDIIESSGSANVDEAMRIALYQWTFAPERTASAGAEPETVKLGIVWK